MILAASARAAVRARTRAQAQERGQLSATGSVPPEPTAPASRPKRTRLPRVLIFCGAVEVAWCWVLTRSLPGTAVARHWAVAWTGLDLVEAAGLIALGLLCLRGDPRRALPAAATAALLAVDAWFDVLTAATRGAFVESLAMAVGVELSLAAVCAAIAWRAVTAAARIPHTTRED